MHKIDLQQINRNNGNFVCKCGSKSCRQKRGRIVVREKGHVFDVFPQIYGTADGGLQAFRR